MKKNDSNTSDITYVKPTSAEDLAERFVPTVSSMEDLCNYVGCKEKSKKAESLVQYFNVLKDADNLEASAKQVLTDHPEALRAVPYLISVTASIKDFFEDGNIITVDLKNFTNPVDDYVKLLSVTGTLDTMKLALENPLAALVRGKVCALDSHARKNRSGQALENIVSKHISDLGFVEVQKTEELVSNSFTNQAKTSDLEKLALMDFSPLGSAVKRFDQAIKIGKHIICIECSHYSTSGSKPNEVARSYKDLARESKDIENFHLVHIVDGAGWKKSLPNLADEMSELDNVFCLADLEAGALKRLVLKIVKEQEEECQTHQ